MAISSGLSALGMKLQALWLFFETVIPPECVAKPVKPKECAHKERQNDERCDTGSQNVPILSVGMGIEGVNSHIEDDKGNVLTAILGTLMNANPGIIVKRILNWHRVQTIAEPRSLYYRLIKMTHARVSCCMMENLIRPST